MKQLLTFLTLTLVMVACKKDTPDTTHHSYPIHIGLSDIAATQSGIANKLVVTESSTGKYLGSFEIPHGVRDFNDQLDINGAPDFRYYYLPEFLHGDTLALTWDDLTPESNLTQVDIQGNPYISTFEIDAVSPDYKNAISVCRSNYVSTPPIFNLPEILPDNWMLRVKVYTSEFFCERLFGMQEPLVIAPPDMSINKLEFSNNQITVNTSGDVDNIRCVARSGFYQIQKSF